MNIGEKIKQARLDAGYTQEQLADLVGVKKSAVAKWQNGRVSEIKRSNLKMLAQSLHIDPSELLDRDSKQFVDVVNGMNDIIALAQQSRSNKVGSLMNRICKALGVLDEDQIQMLAVQIEALAASKKPRGPSGAAI